jgi:transposase
MSISKQTPIQLNREAILAIYEKGPEAVVELVENLIATFAEHISHLEGRIKYLEDQIAKDSHNSSKPPSSDGFRKKPKSQRRKGGRKAGGQNGHKGTTLEMVSNPDHILVHSVDHCVHCGHSLTDIAVSAVEKRQVFDIPPLQLQVTEHQAELKICPCCLKPSKAAFPEAVNSPAQYGTRIKALVVYLMNYQLIPYERCKAFFNDLFSHPLAVGTLSAAHQTCYDALGGVEDRIKQLLLQSSLIHCDETGYYVTKHRYWLHVAASKFLTLYKAHFNRGQKAMDEMGILPYYQGTAIHDYYSSYYHYPCRHALCNAHHLRDLTFLHEQHQQQWAGQMLKLLLEIKQAVDLAKPGAQALEPQTLRCFEDRYKVIIKEGLKECLPHSPPVELTKKRGRKKQSKSKNLLDRFKDRQEEILAFMYDFNIPFDNNLAERDLRMMKVQQKISGCFRTETGADIFCRIRSYISTARKQGVNVIQAIQMALDNQPYYPVLRPE